MAEKALTSKQQLFVDEYLVDLNATQAAIRAGYSEKTARSVGGENLTKPAIAAAIAKAIEARSERTEITSERRETFVFYGVRAPYSGPRRRRDGPAHSSGKTPTGSRN